MRIAITGSTGFVGGHLVRHFSAAGHTVLAYGRPQQPPVGLLRRARYVQADITQPLLPLQADVCIHAAALTSDTADFQELYKANVLGTRYVLEAAAACSHFIQISSSSVYLPADGPLREENVQDRPEGLSGYGHTKLLGEYELHKQPLPHQRRIILRPRGIYGPGDRVLLPRLLAMVRNGRIISLGDLRVLTSLTHIGNLTYAIEKVLGLPAQSTVDTYNVSDAQPYELRKVVQAVIHGLLREETPFSQISPWLVQHLMPLIRTFYKKSRLTPFVVNSLMANNVLDIGKISRDLDYRPPYNLDTDLNEIISWVDRCGGWRKYQQMGERVSWLQV